MGVYRPDPRPQTWVDVIPLLPTGGGVTVNAQARITNSSTVKGESTVTRGADSRITNHSSQRGESAVSRASDSRLSVRTVTIGETKVSRGADSRISQSSGVKGESSVIRGADSRISARSALSGLSSVLVTVAAQARLAMQSLLRGDATVGSQSFPIFDASRLTFRMDVEGRRTFNIIWATQLRLNWYEERSFRILNLEMTKTGVRIDPVVIGDDFRVYRIYTGLPTGITITKAWFTVRTEEDAPSALIAKDITGSPSISSGHIVTATTTSGNLEMYFDPTRSETGAALEATYVYDIQVKTDDDKIYTLEKGTISFITGVTHVTS